MPTAMAHKPSDSIMLLTVNEAGIELQWDIAIRDADFAIGIDSNANGEITWGELQQAQNRLFTWASGNFDLRRDGTACQLTAPTLLVDEHSDGNYAVLDTVVNCPAAEGEFTLAYSLLFEQDPTHRGLLTVDLPSGVQQSLLSPDEPTYAFSTERSASLLKNFGRFFREGVWHIWIGYDHILFLLVLLLPSVLLWQNKKWLPATSLKQSLWSVAGLITAFTVAHSITLALATLSIVSLPSRWVEATIAASIIVAALNNIKPLLHRRLWIIAFLFGLIHGFGFATVLGELSLPAGQLATTLLAFNLGVEAGQLAIVLAFLPLAWFSRKTTGYRWVLNGGSLLAALLAGYWLVERLTG